MNKHIYYYQSKFKHNANLICHCSIVMVLSSYSDYLVRPMHFYDDWLSVMLKNSYFKLIFISFRPYFYLLCHFYQFFNILLLILSDDCLKLTILHIVGILTLLPKFYLTILYSTNCTTYYSTGILICFLFFVRSGKLSGYWRIRGEIGPWLR